MPSYDPHARRIPILENFQVTEAHVWRGLAYYNAGNYIPKEALDTYEDKTDKIACKTKNTSLLTNPVSGKVGCLGVFVHAIVSL